MKTSQPIGLDSDVSLLAIEQSKEGIAIHNERGEFTYINPAMAAMYGYSPDELIGKSWHVFYDSEQIQQIEEVYFPLLLESGYWRGELIGQKKNGGLFNVDLSLSQLYNHDGQISGLVCRSQDVSDSKQIELELIKQKQQYQLVFDHSPVLIAFLDHTYCYRFANKRYCEWVGVSEASIVGSHLEQVLSQKAFALTKPKIDLALAGEEVNFEARIAHASGDQKWVDATYVPDIDAEGVIHGVYAFIVDIDERKQEAFELQTLKLAVEKGIEGFALHDQSGNFTFVNSAQAAMYGYDESELIGKSWQSLYLTEQVEIIRNTYFPLLLSEGQWRGELKGLRKDGTNFDVEVSLTLLKDASGNNSGLFCSCRDISERKRTQEELDFLAYHDHLTGLPNRLLFKERLELALIRARRRESIVAVLFIDLDHFKHINDTLGHSVGDQLLQLVATRIKSVFRAEDTVARLSGDEFTVLLTDITSRESVDLILDKLLQAFRKPVSVGDHEFYQSISVGVSLYPSDGQDVESLMKNADAAMYRAKEEGRQAYRYYKPSLTDVAYESMLFRSQLQNALEKDEFVLHYQPLISLEENKVVGLEALIRWQHPELGLLFPDKFIRHAEESSLIVPMGYWVIEEVCRQIQKWLEVGVEVEQVAVNVSGVQLQTAFTQKVTDILNTSNTDASLLEFEITETFLMKGLKQPVEQLDALRNLGVSLAIDDFGVGYSSLSQLKQLPTQCLKIDRSFVNDIVDDPDDLAIVEAIIALGKTLKLDITAEGVETSKQHELLRQLGCKKTQGYFYAKPCPADTIPALLDELNQRIKTI